MKIGDCFLLKISRLADYAIVLLCEMVTHQRWSYLGDNLPEKMPEKILGETTLTASYLAQQTRIPLTTVAKILKILNQNKILASKRGAQGGYFLRQDANKISLAEILIAIEGPVALTDCIQSDNETQCNMINFCPLSTRWSQLNREIEKVFQNMSLAQMQLDIFSAPIPTVHKEHNL